VSPAQPSRWARDRRRAAPFPRPDAVLVGGFGVVTPRGQVAPGDAQQIAAHGQQEAIQHGRPALVRCLRHLEDVGLPGQDGLDAGVARDLEDLEGCEDIGHACQLDAPERGCSAGRDLPDRQVLVTVEEHAGDAGAALQRRCRRLRIVGFRLRRTVRLRLCARMRAGDEGEPQDPGQHETRGPEGVVGRAGPRHARGHLKGWRCGSPVVRPPTAPQTGISIAPSRHLRTPATPHPHRPIRLSPRSSAGLLSRDDGPPARATADQRSDVIPSWPQELGGD